MLSLFHPSLRLDLMFKHLHLSKWRCNWRVVRHTHTPTHSTPVDSCSSRASIAGFAASNCHAAAAAICSSALPCPILGSKPDIICTGRGYYLPLIWVPQRRRKIRTNWLDQPWLTLVSRLGNIFALPFHSKLAQESNSFCVELFDIWDQSHVSTHWGR